jgi:predicted membrane protein
MKDEKQPRSPHSLTGLFMGLVVVTVGVLWLLSKLGLVALASFWHYWPAIIIAVGLGNLLQRGVGVSHRVFALLTIGAGTALQLHTLGWIYLQWDFVWPAVIIVVGAWIALTSIFARRPGGRRKKPGLADLPENLVVFGGREARVTAQDWEGGEATAVFGGYNIDLRHAEMQGSEAYFEARAIFGGVEVRVPDHWQVELKGAPIMGAFEDKTRPSRPEPGATPRKLVVSGMAIFGGVEIKN